MRTWLALAGAILVAAALRVAVGPQLEGVDDLGYLSAAASVARGETDTSTSLFRLRVGMSYPLGAAVASGWLETRHFWLLTCAADLIALILLAATAGVLGGPRAAVTAGWLYAVYPLAVAQSVVYLPTAFQVATISAALLLLMLARREGIGAWTAAFGAGVALGAGYLVKEDVALLVPVFAIVAAASRQWRVPVLLVFCAGAATVFGLESLHYLRTEGDALFRLAGTAAKAAPVDENLQLASIWQWHAFARSLFLMPYQVGLFWWAALPAVVLAMRRGGPWRTVALTLAVVGVYLQFGSNSLTSYVPLPKSPRYTAILTPMLILTIAGWLAAAFERRRRVAWAVAAVLVLTSLPCIALGAITAGERMRNVIAVAPVLRDHGVTRLYTDFYSASALKVLAGDRVDVRVWYHAEGSGPQMTIKTVPAPDAGAFLWVDRQSAKVYTSSYGLTLPADVQQVPGGWHSVLRRRAYVEGSASRAALDALRRLGRHVPVSFVAQRIERNVTDMIDADDAELFAPFSR
jgi:hypothetical protein